MNCKKVHKILSENSVNELNKDLRIEVSNHLSECKTCYSLNRNSEGALNKIQTNINIEVSPFIYTRIQQKIAERQKRTPAYYFIKSLNIAAVAILIGMGIFIGIKLGNKYNIDNKVENSLSEYYYMNDSTQNDLELLYTYNE